MYLKMFTRALMNISKDILVPGFNNMINLFTFIQQYAALYVMFIMNELPYVLLNCGNILILYIRNAHYILRLYLLFAVISKFNI